MNQWTAIKLELKNANILEIANENLVENVYKSVTKSLIDHVDVVPSTCFVLTFLLDELLLKFISKTMFATRKLSIFWDLE